MIRNDFRNNPTINQWSTTVNYASITNFNTVFIFRIKFQNCKIRYFSNILFSLSKKIYIYPRYSEIEHKQIFLQKTNLPMFPLIIWGKFFLTVLSSQFHHCISTNFLITSAGKRFLISFAGTPPTIVYGGTSLVTTALAAIMAPSPICTPCMITASNPIHTSLPIIISP